MTDDIAREHLMTILWRFKVIKEYWYHSDTREVCIMYFHDGTKLTALKKVDAPTGIDPVSPG